MSYEHAVKKYREKHVKIFGKPVVPLQWQLSGMKGTCVAKVVCNMKDNGRIVGCHYIGPHAGEVMQGLAGMMSLRATHSDLMGLIGIHPTTVETFVTLEQAGMGEIGDGCTTWG